MALTRTIVLNRGNFPNGTRNIPERAVADNLKAVGMALARNTSAEPTLWPNASTTVAVSLDVFVDGVWQTGGSITASGGLVVDDGAEAVETLMLFSLPAGVNRQIRASVVIAGGPLRTEVTLLEET